MPWSSSSFVFFQSPPLLIIIIKSSSNYLHVSSESKPDHFLFAAPRRPRPSVRPSIHSLRFRLSTRRPRGVRLSAVFLVVRTRQCQFSFRWSLEPSEGRRHLRSFHISSLSSLCGRRTRSRRSRWGKQMMTVSHDGLATRPRPPACRLSDTFKTGEQLMDSRGRRSERSAR